MRRYAARAALGSFLRRLPLLPRDHVGGVPHRPVVLRTDRFVLAMVLFGLSQQRCGVTSVAPISTPRSRSPTSLIAPV